MSLNFELLSDPESIYQLKVIIRGIKPKIWRRVQVPGSTTLRKLHEILQVVMGWSNYHLYAFFHGGTEYGNPDLDEENSFTVDDSEVTLFEINDKIATSRMIGEKTFFLYRYDFGDGWDHEIIIENIFPKDDEKNYPVCIGGRKACPPEDVGGICGYNDFLEAIKNPSHPEHVDKLNWIGYRFNPESFNLNDINNRLKRFFISLKALKEDKF